MAHLGQTFINKPAPGVPPHLWMVVSDPAKGPRVVLVNVSSTKCPSGEECVIRRGEHASASHDSYVRFREVRVSDLGKVDQGLKAGVLQQAKDLDPKILQRVQRAVVESKAVPTEAKDILRAQGVGGEAAAT